MVKTQFYGQFKHPPTWILTHKSESSTQQSTSHIHYSLSSSFTPMEFAAEIATTFPANFSSSSSSSIVIMVNLQSQHKRKQIQPRFTKACIANSMAWSVWPKWNCIG